MFSYVSNGGEIWMSQTNECSNYVLYVCETKYGAQAEEIQKLAKENMLLRKKVNQRKSELCIKIFQFSASTDGPGPCSAILTGIHSKKQLS